MRRLLGSVLLVGCIIAAVIWLPRLRSDHQVDSVFLIVVDTLRPDRLSCYGYTGHETPAIDGLAARGVRFDAARSVASWTIPSMGAMFTSLYPTQLGLIEQPPDSGQTFVWRERREQCAHSIPDRELTLAEVLQTNGFTTAAFVNQPGLNTGNSYMQGFDFWYYPETPENIVRHDPAEKLKYKSWPPFLRHACQSDTRLVATFERWLGTHSDEKVFAWIHLLTPHAPYNPPPRFAPPGDKASNTKRYDGEIRAVDAMVQDLLAAIEKHVGLQNTLTIFTSDHGEAFREHGMSEHGHSLHAEVVNVPLIMAGGGLDAVDALDVVSAPVRLTDIFPTILDLFGLDAVNGLQGASLVPLLRGAQQQRPVFSEAMLYGSTERSYSRDGFKLMFDEQREGCLLFDLTADPGELSDLASDMPTKTEALKQDLTELHKALVADKVQRTAGHAGDDSLTSIEDLEEIRRALRSLGY